MSFTIKATASIGNDWEHLIKEAYLLAGKIDANIEFDFNGLTVTVFQNGNVVVFKGSMDYVTFTVKTIPEHPPYPKKSNPIQ